MVRWAAMTISSGNRDDHVAGLWLAIDRRLWQDVTPWQTLSTASQNS